MKKTLLTLIFVFAVFNFGTVVTHNNTAFAVAPGAGDGGCCGSTPSTPTGGGGGGDDTPEKPTCDLSIVGGVTEVDAIGDSYEIEWNGGPSSATFFINGTEVSDSGSASFTFTGPNYDRFRMVGNNGGVTCTDEVRIIKKVEEVKKCELEVTKTVDKHSATPGEELTYEIKVKNTGTADCTGGGVKIEDVLDSNFEYVSNTYTSNFSEGYGSAPVYTASTRTIRFNGNTLTPGESGTIVLFGKVSTPNTCGDYVVKNQAKATAYELNSFTTWVYSSIVKTNVDYDCETPAPLCTSFTAVPGVLPAGGGQVVLDWDLLNVATASIDNGVGDVTVGAGTANGSMSGSKTVNVTESTTFTLTAKNVEGDSVSCVAPVIVQDTEVPTPSCDLFTSNPAVITVGGTATLSWESTNAVQAFINNAIGAVDVDGSIEVSPLADTTYVLTLIGAEDNTVNCSVPVKVVDEPVMECVAFTATPPALPVGGGNITLAWEVINAVSVSIDNGIGAVALTGSRTEAITQSTTFNLTATDADGNTVSCLAPVAVADPAVFTCENNVSFSASDTSITRGQSSTLTWSTTNVDSLTISGINATALSGNQSVSPTVDTTYTLAAIQGSETISCPVTINVSTGGGGGGSSSPRCELEISESRITAGDEIELTWDSTRARELTITDSFGNVLVTTKDKLSDDKDDLFEGSLTLNPTRNTTYTMVVERGSRDRECEVDVKMDDEIVLLQVRDQAPLVSGISLTQVPYTGFEAGPVMTVLFYMLLITWALYITYVLVMPKAQLAMVSSRSNGVQTNGDLMQHAEQIRPDVFAAVSAAPVVAVPANLPVAIAPAAMPVVTEIPDTNTIENQAHALQALISSDAARTIAGMTNESNQAEVLGKIVSDAKGQFPLEDGWVVINQSRLAQITDTTAAVVSPSPTGAGSLAEAIVTGNVVAAYALVGSRPMIALADAAADLDAVYRIKKGAAATVSDMLAEETADLSEEQIAGMIAALTGALDGTYTDEVSAVKMAIMKAIKVTA